MTDPVGPAPDAPPDGPSDDEWSRAPLSPALPRVASIYDALLGGSGNRAADRAAARQLAAAIPGAERAVRDNRAFVARAADFLAAKASISQFLDIGAGPLARGSVHEIAQAANPEARVVYVDNGPLVVEETRSRLPRASLLGWST